MLIRFPVATMPLQKLLNMKSLNFIRLGLAVKLTFRKHIILRRAGKQKQKIYIYLIGNPGTLLAVSTTNPPAKTPK